MIGETSTIRPTDPTPLSAARDTKITFTTAGDAAAGPDAEKVPHTVDSPLYDVERETAADFMAYLAASLGQLEDLDYVPVTDRRRYWEPLLREARQPAARRNKLTDLRLEVLEDILPAPRQPLSAGHIWAFKKRHGRQLTTFRRAVERELVVAASITDRELRNRRLQLFREEVDAEVKHIQARLGESGYGDLVFGKICSVMAAIPGVSFIFGLANAVYNTCQKSPEVEPPSPLVYAAYAQVELLVKK
jgi:hypothetical protein